MDFLFGHRHWNNQDFQSASVRLAISLYAVVLILLSHQFGKLSGSLSSYLYALAFLLPTFLGLFISTIVRPQWPARRIISIGVDVSGITLCSYLADQAISAYCLLYIWIVVSYGARYGKKHLFYAAAGSAIAYTLLATTRGFFISQPAETSSFLACLIVFPFYQYRIISARIAAEQQERLKSQFLSTMTHELRTPLSGVIGMSRLLCSTRLNEEQADYVQAIRSSADDLMLLIGDILDLSKIDADKLPIRNTLFDLRECVFSVCSSLSSRAADKALELICHIDNDVMQFFRSDEMRLKQILYNLIGNAIKFTDAGEVEVHVHRSPVLDGRRPVVSFDVRDTGIGIPTELHDKIFEVFWQDDTSPTRKHGGTGLGTTIARRLARALGGDVILDSWPAKGSVFTLQVPVDAAAVDAPPGTRIDLTGRRVGVVEGNAQVRAIVQEILQSSNAQVVTAGDMRKDLNIDAIIVGDDFNKEDMLPSALSWIGNQWKGTVLTILLGYSNRVYDPGLPRTKVLRKPFLSEHLLEALSELDEKAPASGSEGVRRSLGRSGKSRSRARVLVAEDEPINAKVVRALLSKSGHNVLVVDNGIAALEMLSTNDFDLALLDVRMPGMTGIEVAKEVRARETNAGRHLAIVALTASALSDVRDECLSAGMDDFLVKPIDPDSLDQLVERVARLG